MAPGDPGQPVRRIRLGFLVAALVVGVASVAESVVEIERGRWGLTSTLALYAFGVAVGGFNLIYPSSPETAAKVSAKAWPIGIALTVLFAVRQMIDIDMDKVLIPVGGGLCLLLAALLAVDRARGNRLAGWDDEQGES